jgi:hypothetical protein
VVIRLLVNYPSTTTDLLYYHNIRITSAGCISTVEIRLDISGDQIYSMIVLVLLSIGPGTKLDSSRSLPDKAFLVPTILLQFKCSLATMVMQISDTGDRSNMHDPMGDFISPRVHHGAGLESSMLILTHAPPRTFKYVRLSSSTFDEGGDSIRSNGNGPSFRPPSIGVGRDGTIGHCTSEINSPS